MTSNTNTEWGTPILNARSRCGSYSVHLSEARRGLRLYVGPEYEGEGTDLVMYLSAEDALRIWQWLTPLVGDATTEPAAVDPDPLPDGITITQPFGGQCPVQAEGTVDGVTWYFRARDTVSVSVGPEPIGWWEWEWDASDWAVERWPDLRGGFPRYFGYMTHDRCRVVLLEGLRRWRESGGTSEVTP